MDDKEKDETLRDMARRRVAALRDKAGSEAALEILKAQGSVTEGEVFARIETTWTPPTGRELAAQVAQKAWSSVEAAKDAVEAQGRLVEGLAVKAEKYRVMAADADAEHERASQDESLVEAVRRAEELAVYADEHGNAGEAPDPTVADAFAAIAEVTAKGAKK